MNSCFIFVFSYVVQCNNCNIVSNMLNLLHTPFANIIVVFRCFCYYLLACILKRIYLKSLSNNHGPLSMYKYILYILLNVLGIFTWNMCYKPISVQRLGITNLLRLLYINSWVFTVHIDDRLTFSSRKSKLSPKISYLKLNMNT